MAPIDLMFFTQEEVHPWLGPPLDDLDRNPDLDSRYLKDSSPLRDRTKYYLKLRNDVISVL